MPTRPQRQDSADDGAGVRARLAAGRTMAALREAKELAKRTPGPQSEALLVEAYRARVLDLASLGLHQEARELLRVARARCPQAEAGWLELSRQAARAAGDLEDLLVAWRDGAGDQDARAAIGEELQAALRDLRPLAASPLLAIDDDLRAAAARLHDAFVAASSGTLDEATRAGLAAADPPVPLRAWHAFVLALAAFHARHDDEALAALDRIPDTSGVGAGKRLLRDLLEGRADRAVAPAARRLALALTDGALPAWQALAELRAEQAPVGRRRAAARTLLVELCRRAPRSAARFVWYLRRAREHDPLVEELDHGLGASLFGADWLRQTADLDAGDDPVLGTTTWLTWLMPETEGQALRPLSPRTLAELLQHLAPIARAAVAAIEARLGRNVGALLGDPEALTIELRPFSEAEPESEVEYAVSCAAVMAEALRRLRSATGLSPQLGDARQFLEHAAALHPSDDAFAALADALADAEDDVRRACLERWAQAVPASVEPCLRLVELHAARGRDAERTAWLRQAEARAPAAPSVEAARLRALLETLKQHVRRGEVSVAALLAAELAGEPAAQTPEARALLAAVMHVLAHRDDERHDAALVGAADDPVRAAATLDLVRHELLGLAVEPPANPRGRDSLRRAAWLWRLAQLFPGAAALVPRIRYAGAELPAGPGDRLALSEIGAAQEDWELVEAASDAEVANDGPQLARVIYLRALAARGFDDDPDATRDLFALARYLAAAAGDDATRRAAEAARGPLDDDFDAETAAEVLAEERDFVRGARVVVADHTRPLTERERLQRRRAREPRADQGPDADRGAEETEA